MKITYSPGVPGTIAVAIDGQPSGSVQHGVTQLDTLKQLADLVEAATEATVPPAPETAPAVTLDVEVPQ